MTMNLNPFHPKNGDARLELVRRSLERRKRIEELNDPDILLLQDEYDFMWMTYEGSREIHREWGVQARKIAPKSGRESGCDCDVCAISRALDHAGSVYVSDPDLSGASLEGNDKATEPA
jgi:hypothetical protein